MPTATDFHDLPTQPSPAPLNATDQALAEWRALSEQRFQEQLVAQRLEAQRLEKRRKNVLGIGIVVATLAVGATLTAVTRPMPVVVAEQAAPASALLPPVEAPASQDRIEARSPLGDPGSLGNAAMVIPPLGQRSPEAAETVEVAPDATADRDSAGPVVAHVMTWSDSGTLWAQLDFARSQPVELRWLDGAGTEVMGRYPCKGGIDATTGRCYVGRTAARVDGALTAGAQAGQWRVEACLAGTESCTPVGTYTVASAGR